MTLWIVAALIVAALVVVAVVWTRLSRRRVQVWQSDEVTEIWRRARDRAASIGRWADEPGDPTREHIDDALAIVERAKADHLNAAMQAVEHPYTHLTAEEAADCTVCSPSGLPRRLTEGT